MLELTGVTIARGGRPVVRDVDLQVPAGQVTALLGANGAGKSSLVLGVAGVLPLVRGSVRVDGREIAGRPPHRVRAAGVAVVPEGHRVFRELTVAEHLAVGGSRLPAARTQEAVDEAFATFPELERRRDQRAGGLSGGEQQMLAIATALIQRPSFLVLDELSLGLAPAIVRRLEGVVAEIAASGVGILLIEQFATVALALATGTALLDRGSVTFSGAATELQEQPELLHGAYWS